VCSAGKADLVRSLGAGRVIDYASEDFARSGEQYDLILYVAGSRSLSDCRKALTPEGTLVLIGGEGGRWLGGAERFMQALIVSPFVRHRLVPLIAEGAESTDDLGVLRDLTESGKITPAVDRCYELSETPDAIRYLESGHVRGKVVISL
jgi:NADPH:quinone reductase-like Zn-dependent oxidoreductase